MSALSKITIAGRGTVVADRCVLATSMHARFIGLLKHEHLTAGEGMLLQPCNHVHTLFMKFPIDAVFLDKNGTVLGFDELAPWRLSRLFWRARQVLELPRGRCREVGLNPGDQLEVTPCFS
ncbi:MAG: DUF192 domain-containing protein [Bdellovibrionales bacterium]|nr:DUF192 domain-containing protein [Bdellovibrionales bacterium]